MKWIGVVVIVTVIGLVILIQTNSAKPASAVEVLGVKTTDFGKLERDRAYWEKIVADSPTYRDGYIQLALVNVQEAKPQDAKLWVLKALEVDPNFELSPTLLVLLQKD